MTEKTQSPALFDILYNAQDTARILNLHVNVVYELIANGELEAHKISRRTLRISKSAIVRYLDSHKIVGELQDDPRTGS